MRVPAIWQWKGHIPAYSHSNYFAATTDLMPTFLHAANIKKAKDLKMDGISLLPIVLKASVMDDAHQWHNHYPSKHVPGEKEVHKMYLWPTSEGSNGGNSHDRSTAENRVFLWHKDTDPYSREDQRMESAGYYDFIKIIAPGGCVDRVFDLKHDPLENKNLLSRKGCFLNFDNFDKKRLAAAMPVTIAEAHCASVHTETSALNACVTAYHTSLVSKITVIMERLISFVRYGNRGHQRYMSNWANNATCSIPVASQLKVMEYSANSDCQNFKFGCSEPEY